MRRNHVPLAVLVLAFVIVLIVAACGGAATQAPPATEAPAATFFPATEAPAATGALSSETQVPVTTATVSVQLPTNTPASIPTLTIEPTRVEPRLIELEWPPTMRLGESDLIRISLAIVQGGVVVTAEFDNHLVATQAVVVPRPTGYDLEGIGQLNGVGFEIEPTGEQIFSLPEDQRVTWRWTITPRAVGQQRLSLNLRLRWTPSFGNTQGTVRETTLFDRGLNVNVNAFFGLTSGQATALGFIGLMVGGGLSLPLAATFVIRPRRKSLPSFAPNDSLVIEKHPSFDLTPEEKKLLQVLFRRYARLTLEAEFRSGYSGARTFLALPVHADGRADAYTIAKIGDVDSIQREYENYERFVKDTLPPITARIQESPVQLPGTGGGRAVLRYTFIGEAGKMPTSLRELLISNSPISGQLLEKLFSTFGPNWWMQRRPYTFRLAQEYDRMLPAHFVLEPVETMRASTETMHASSLLDGRREPSAYNFKVGDVVALKHLRIAERRPDGKSLSLVGETVPGHPPLRVRWHSLTPPEGATAKVVATRETLLREFVKGYGLFGLPDPILKLTSLLNERVIGTQSTIHGDLNVENILVGLGDFLWLIDFAQTRDGHTLYDFAHLEAEIIAHVIAPKLTSPSDILSLIPISIQSSQSPHAPLLTPHALLSTLHTIATRCLFNPNQPREYQLALTLACLGALKFTNLNSHQKHALYLAAAQLAQSL
jgi:hypothetical protein